SARREAGRSSGTGADQVRAGNQSQSRQGDRIEHPANIVAPRRRGDRVKRREFIALLGGAATWPLAARGQQSAMPVIGLLDIRSPDADRLRGFRQGLKDNGYVERENVVIEYRSAENSPDLLRELAADLVRRQVAVFVTTGGVVA